jgi:hypothetical protein
MGDASPGTWPASACAGHERSRITKHKQKHKTKENTNATICGGMQWTDGAALCGQAADERFLKQNLRLWNCWYVKGQEMD